MEIFTYKFIDSIITLSRNQCEQPDNLLDSVRIKQFEQYYKYNITDSDEMKKLVRRSQFCFKLVALEKTIFPTQEYQMKQILERRINARCECSLQRQPKQEFFFNKMLLYLFSFDSFYDAIKFYRDHPIFNTFQMYFMFQILDIPKHYNYDALYFTFNYPKIAAYYFNLVKSEENYFIPIRMQPECLLFNVSSCLLSVNQIYSSLGLYGFDNLLKQFLPVLDVITQQQIFLDENIENQHVQNFRKQFASITYDKQKRYTSLGSNFFLDEFQPPLFAAQDLSQRSRQLNFCKKLTCPLDKYQCIALGQVTQFNRLEAANFSQGSYQPSDAQNLSKRPRFNT